eukprot:1152762-Pelagomonas_calceolata.AAC.4
MPSLPAFHICSGEPPGHSVQDRGEVDKQSMASCVQMKDIPCQSQKPSCKPPYFDEQNCPSLEGGKMSPNNLSFQAHLFR